MIQQPQTQRSQGAAALYDAYGSYDPSGLNGEEVSQLVRYCLGVIHNPGKAGTSRYAKARRILIQQGHKVPNLLPPALKDEEHLDDIVRLFREIVQSHPDKNFIDLLVRYVSGAINKPEQRNGAVRVLQLEELCEPALKYVVNNLQNEEAYPALSAYFKHVAAKAQHRRRVFDVLSWAVTKPNLAINAALVLNAIEDRYTSYDGTAAAEAYTAL